MSSGGYRGVDGRFVTAADPLRGLAALGVVVFHCGALAGIAFAFEHRPWTVLHRTPILLLESGNIGVWMFFTLSGYLLGRPFIAAYVAGRPLPDVAAYLRNRALRLLPGMLAVFAITLAIVGRFGSAWGRVGAIPLLTQVYFPSALSHSYLVHFWTLDDEWAFYLALPLVFWAALRTTPRSWAPVVRRRALLAGIAALGAVSVVLVGQVPVGDLDRQEWFPMVICAFAPGLALATLETSLPARLDRDPRGPRIALVLLVAAVIPFAYWVGSVAHPDVALRNLAGCATAGLILSAALVRQWSGAACWRALDNRPLQWLGKRSYSLYLIHLIVLTKLVVPLHRAPGPGALLVYLVVGLAVLAPLTALSYELLERPFLARRRAWRRPAPVASAPEPAAVVESGIAAVLPVEP